jgi:carbonic anhydrase
MQVGSFRWWTTILPAPWGRQVCKGVGTDGGGAYSSVPIGEKGGAVGTEELLRNNEAYRNTFTKADLHGPPAKSMAVLACMDARLDVHKILGLEEGDAHILRNAGGVATDDVIRSLAISQRLLGTREIILIHHTDCGMLTFTEEEVKQQIAEEVGFRPHFALESFTDLEDDLRDSIARIKHSPFVPHKDEIHGFIYNVATGGLETVT